MQVNGAAIAPEKCWWYLIDFTWTGGKWKLWGKQPVKKQFGKYGKTENAMADVTRLGKTYANNLAKENNAFQQRQQSYQAHLHGKGKNKNEKGVCCASLCPRARALYEIRYRDRAGARRTAR